MKDAEGNRISATDGELVAEAVGGSAKAFEVLVYRHQRRATEVAYRLLSNMDDAMEVTQEAFLRAYRKLQSLSVPEKFGSWLLQIVSNQALNFRRGRALRYTVNLDRLHPTDRPAELNIADPSAISPGAEASAKELKQAMRQAIDQLPEKQRLALVLFSIQKLPQKQVAEVLNISVEAVKWHVFTARKKLKEKFKDYL